MSLQRALTIAMVLTLAGLSPAVAQFPAPPVPNNSGAFPPPPQPGQAPAQASPFPPAPAPGGGATRSPFSAAPAGRPAGPPNACESFVPLRAEAEKGAAAIRAASEHKASREEVCPLFQRFAAAEAKVVKFLETHMTQCGVPPEAVKQSKANHAQTLKIRTAVCAKAPPAAGPSLSDALGGPVISNEDKPKPGRGTFDTLTGPVPR